MGWKCCSLATIRITRITEYFVYHLENIILKRARWVKAIPHNHIPEGRQYQPLLYAATIGRQVLSKLSDMAKNDHAISHRYFHLLNRIWFQHHFLCHDQQPKHIAVVLMCKKMNKILKLDMIKAINEICNLESFSAHASFSSNYFLMKLDCVRIQSHQFVHVTSVQQYLLLIHNNFLYHAYHCGIKTAVKSLSQNRITYL